MSIKQFLTRNAGIILTGASVLGVVATAVVASRDTVKAIRIVNDISEDERNVKTVIKSTWHCYIPTVLTAAATVACVISGHATSVKTQKGLISAYTMLDRGFKEYREKTVEIYGEDADRKIREAILNGKAVNIPFSTGEGELFHDFYSGRYFESTMEAVYRAEYELNLLYHRYGYATLNEFYDILGLSPVDGGDEIGWSMDASNQFYGYDSIEFENERVILDDGLQANCIVMLYPPTADFLV